jgi:hypothetical protein
MLPERKNDRTGLRRRHDLDRGRPVSHVSRARDDSSKRAGYNASKGTAGVMTG